MKRAIAYIWTFTKTLFRQLFSSAEIEKVEQENDFKKLDLQKPLSFKEWKALKKSLIRYYTKPCQLCKKPMTISRGQIAYYHSACRKKGRVLFAKPA